MPAGPTGVVGVLGVVCVNVAPTEAVRVLGVAVAVAWGCGVGPVGSIAM